MDADDQRLHLSFKPSKSGSQIDCIAQLEKTISETKAWMSANMLKLNDEKPNSYSWEHASNFPR